MSQTNLDIVKSMYAAFARGDMKTVFEFLDPQFEFCLSDEIPWGGQYRGHQEYKILLKELTSIIEATVEHDLFLDSGNHVVSIGETVGRVRASGKKFRVSAIHILELKEGKAVRIEVYLDNPLMLVALEAEPAAEERGMALQHS